MTFLGIWCFLCFEMGFSLPSMWSGKWVAQIGAFYCNGWILRASKSEGTGLFFFFFFFLPCLPRRHRLSEKWLTPLPRRRWQTVSGMTNHSGKSLAGVDKVCVMFGEVLFMQLEQTSFLISLVQLISLLHSSLCVTSHTCTSLDIYVAWILEVQWKTSLSLYPWPCLLYWVVLLTLGIKQQVIIDSHMDTHFLLTATLGCSHQPAFLLTTVCRTQ